MFLNCELTHGQFFFQKMTTFFELCKNQIFANERQQLFLGSCRSKENKLFLIIVIQITTKIYSGFFFKEGCKKATLFYLMYSSS